MGLVAICVPRLLAFEVVAIPPQAFEVVAKDSDEGPGSEGREGDHAEPGDDIVYFAAGGLRAYAITLGTDGAAPSDIAPRA